MSLREAQRFLAAIAADPVLAGKATAAVQGKSSEEATRALSEFAAGAGYHFTMEEITQERQAADAQPLSDGDLDRIAGGVDDASNSISQLFAQYGQEYQELSAEASAFHDAFLNALKP